MKFLKYVLKNTLALLLAWVLLLVLSIVSLAILAAGFAPGKSIKIEKGSFLILDLSKNLPDRPPVADFSSVVRRALQGEPEDETHLYEVLRIVERAAADDRIKGIFLTGSFSPRGMGSTYPAVREFRQALEEFREAGKPVYGYLTNASQRDLYLMSVADKLILNPAGIIDLTGIGAEVTFYEGMLEKFGLGIQVARVGSYKSAAEPFMRSDLSEENREQLEDLLDGIWSDIKEVIANGRGLSPSEIQELSDSKGVVLPSQAFEAGLVDETWYLDEVIEFLISEGRKDEKNRTFEQVGLLAYVEEGKQTVRRTPDSKNKIAVVYAEGTIVPGDDQEGMIGGDGLARTLRQLRQDDDVKAVVLRINSPGGSAYAAELIHREMQRTRAVKPLIVSQGGYAASGGYWISAHSDYIFTEPTTLTGSIGVILMLPHFQGAAEWLGLTFDEVSTGPLATLGTPTRPKTDEEMEIFQGFADHIYDAFLELVVNGRDIDIEKVEELSKGRVWLGRQAVEFNLADEVGGLRDAIRFAVDRANVGADYRIVEYPTKKTFEEALMERFAGDSTLIDRWSNGNADSALDRLMVPARRELEKLRTLRDPNGVYALMPFDIRF